MGLDKDKAENLMRAHASVFRTETLKLMQNLLVDGISDDEHRAAFEKCLDHAAKAKKAITDFAKVNQ